MKSSLFKTIARSLILAVSVLAFAGASYAATTVNEYGTSEEFGFWGTISTTLLTTLGCTGGTAKYTIAGNTTTGITVGTGCPDSISSDNGTHDNTIYFSYTNKPSWDAIDAVNDFYDSNNWGTWNTNNFPPTLNSGGTSVNPCKTDITVAGVTYHPGSQRQAATCPSGGCSTSSPPTLQCQPVHVGSANLESTSIIQLTTGTLKGPLDQQDANTNTTVRNYGPTGPPTNNLTLGSPAFTFTNTDLSGLPAAVQYTKYQIDNPARPLAYPFGFYVNPGVTASRCKPSTINAGQYCYPAGTFGGGTASSGDTFCGGGSGTCKSGTPNAGQVCTADVYCGNNPIGSGDCSFSVATGVTAGDCESLTIDQLSRLQVVALFSGSITNWNEFGAYYVNKPVTLCLRHSGAGTLSVIDLGVMQGSDGSGWGAGLVTQENRASSGSPPYAYFNDLSSDMLNCLTWSNGGYTPSTSVDTLAAGELGGGVGFIDADTAGSANYVQVKYNGLFGTRGTMRNGIYDNFWMIDALYIPSTLTEAQMTVYATMLTLVSNPANIGNAGASRVNYYGASSELNFPKPAGGDYPYTYNKGSTPLTP
jgi:hypothetical protein